MSRKIISCPACNARFDVGKYPPGARVRCGRCSQVLTVPGGENAEAAPISAAPISVAAASTGGSAERGVSAAAKPPSPKSTQDAPPSPVGRSDAAVATALGVPAAEGRDPLLGRVVNGQFRVVRKLGEGGYGAVYEAKDVNLERRIALKVMLPSRAASREYVAKFFREARTAAQLSHPNVVAIHGVGLDKENNVYFLAMEFVEGRTLHDVMQERGPLPVEEAIDYLVQSCRGLAAAHERNIIHRDIKPGNLMITPGGAIKITDFGLAKISEGEGGQASTVIGTPYFMPPEQFEGKARDGRTDIYALGVTFYYMLTMQRPHTGSGPAQILLSVMTKEPTSVLEHRADLPEGVWPVVRRMIDRDPERRYSNCLDIAADLQQVLGGGEEVEQIYCGGCGAPNPVDSAECSACKASLTEKCPVCGGEDAAGTRFCGNCGANIPVERAVAALVDEARQLLSVGRIVRAREKLQQAQERSTENLAVADLVKELEAKREQRDAHVEAIREHLAKGRTAEASERLKLAKAQFPESAEIAEAALDVEDALADPETTGVVVGVAHAALEAKRLEDAGRVREALVAWRGVRLLLPKDDEARAGEARTAERVERCEKLLAAGAELLSAGDPDAALELFQQADEVLPGDMLVAGRLQESVRASEDLKTELASIASDAASNGAETAAPRLRALAERFPTSRMVSEVLARFESAGREADRDAVLERLGQIASEAQAHEDARRVRAAAEAWREGLSLEPDFAQAQEGLARTERTIAEFEAMLGQSRNLLSSGDPEGAERVADEALALVADDPDAEAHRAGAAAEHESLRREAGRIRAARADDDSRDWARELATRYPGSALAADVVRETETKSRKVADRAAGAQVAARLDRARRLESEGNFVQALKTYREILAGDAEHAESKSAAARIELRLDRAQRKASLARELLADGDPEGARAEAEASLELLADQRETAGTLAGARTAIAEIERAAQAFAEEHDADSAQQQFERLKRLQTKYPRSARCAELTRSAGDMLAAAAEREASARVAALLDDARAALESGRLDDAEAACGEALQLDPDAVAAHDALAVVRARVAQGATLLAEARADLEGGRNADARDKFAAALAADPRLVEAEEGRDAADAASRKAAAELAEAVERATTLSRSAGLIEAAAAWDRVVALDPADLDAREERSRLRARIEKATSEASRGKALLESGDPEAAVSPLETACAELGACGFEDALAAARERAAEIAKRVLDLESALGATDGDLSEFASAAVALAARFPGSGRAKEAAEHAAKTAHERRRQLAVARVRRLVRERRYGDARDLAVSLRAEGVESADLDAAAAQAEQAIAKVEGLRRRAAEARRAGRLEEARDALREVLVALPDEAETKSAVAELDATIREIGARRDAADASRRRGAIAQAIEFYREALALRGADPELESAMKRLAGEASERGRLLAVCQDAVRRGDGRTCADGAKQLLDRYPEDDDARDLHTTGDCMDRVVASLLSIARRQIAAGERAEAAQTLECLLRVSPGHEEASKLLRA